MTPAERWRWRRLVAEQQGTQRPVTKVTELRVHGVGGSPGPALLGLREIDPFRVVKRRGGIVITERTGGCPVQGFDWGALTSGSRFHALWVLLLPFTLLNVAGWAHPRREDEAYPGQVSIQHGLVTLLGWLLTATWTLWVADILVGYAGYQWIPRATGNRQVVAPLLPFGLWHLRLTPTALRGFGVVAGMTVVLGILVGVRVLSKRTQATIAEPQRRGPFRAEGAWSRGEGGVFDAAFFGRRGSWAASSVTHLVIALGACALVVYRAIEAVAADPQPTGTGIDVILLGVGGLQLVLLFLLGLMSWLLPRVRRRRKAADAYRSGGTATAAAVLAFAITNAVFSGTVLWLVKYLGEHPRVAGSNRLVVGRELATVDAYFLVVVIWLAMAGALVLYRSRLQPAPDNCQPAPIPPDWARRVANGQATARIFHKADRFVVALAVAFWLVGAGLTALRLEWKGHGRLPWRWQLDPPTTKGVAYLAAAWLLPTMVVFIVYQLRRAAGDSRTRRFIGQLWDVLTFWPRRFHPFAVRPYAQLAVPELREHIEALAMDGAVLVSAHSQGSALAVAAVASLSPEVTSRVALVTYGSHVAGLYRRAFPAYFNSRQVASLRATLTAGRWHNFFRLTDPIGGPVFPPPDGAVRDPADHCLADPAVAPAVPSPGPDAPLESDREPEVDLAVHSYYLREPELKATVVTLKVELAGS